MMAELSRAAVHRTGQAYRAVGGAQSPAADVESFAGHEGAEILVRQRLATVTTLRAIDDRHHPAPATRTDRGRVEVKTPVEEPGGDLAHVAQGCSAHEREAGVAEGVPRRVEEQLSGERGGGHARRVSQGEPASAS